MTEEEKELYLAIAKLARKVLMTNGQYTLQVFIRKDGEEITLPIRRLYLQSEANNPPVVFKFDEA